MQHAINMDGLPLDPEAGTFVKLETETYSHSDIGIFSFS
jgi:hypothetical protein